MKGRDIPIAVHVGYHKTATTFLQKKVFNHHPQVLYLGKPWCNEEMRGLFSDFNFTHPLLFRSKVFQERFYRAVDGVVDSTVMQKGQDAPHLKAVLVSQESLHSGPEWFGISVVDMAHRIKDVFSEAKIVIGLRYQTEFIESFYKEYILHGGKLTLRDFLARSFAFNYALKPKLMYDKMLSIYDDLFGWENIHVYLLEDVKCDLAGELEKLRCFLGVDSSFVFEDERVNEGINSFFIPPIILLNRLVADDFVDQYYRAFGVADDTSRDYLRRNIVSRIRKLGNLSSLKGLNKNILAKNDREAIENIYRSSNRRLAGMLGRDLTGWRY